MAELFVELAGPSWHTNKKRFLLSLDEYEFVNLRWLMETIWSNRYQGVNLHNGDWAGQIRHALMETELDMTLQSPNAPMPEPLTRKDVSS